MFFFSCDRAPSTDSISEAERIKLLLKYYPHANEGEVESQKLFFKYFPDSFSELNRLYGYDDSTGAMPLYDEAANHIAKLFFKLDKSVGIDSFFDKMIGISKEGKWEADAVNYFQRGLREKVKSNLSYSINRLDKLTKEEIKGFWYFYFDGPHPTELISDELEKVKIIDNYIYSLMVEAHQQVIMDHNVH